uniref:Ig-like domain-containing protein n=1 Tax=Lynx canadensis TaxID=61383 RepID=A0A667HQU4_LYNCA
MGVLTRLLCLLLACLPAAGGTAELTQSPTHLSVSLRDSVSLICRANESVSDYLSWYQQKPGQPPKLIIYDADDLESGVSDRFSGIQSGTEFILKISTVEADDAAAYYCQQGYVLPPTVLQPRT